MFGFFGKMLRINLITGDHFVEVLEEELLKKYLGGRGLATYLLNRLVPPGTDPLGPGNPVIFVTGPAAGTIMPGASRYSVFSKSPLTGGFGEASSGGRVAAAMKSTGYDAIVIEGKSDKPVYLEISDREVKVHDAGHLWGKDTYFTEDAVIAEVGQEGAEALVIGPAGENLVRFACLENNYWRSAGRTGMGAVMGSKKLKAVVFHGQAACQLADPELLKELVMSLREKAKDDPGAKNYRTYGTPVMVSILNKAGVFPARYWSKGRSDHWEKINGDALLNNFDVKAKACPHCMLACGKLTKVREGEYQGLTVEGPEYETIYAFGGLCEIDRLDEILKLNDLCDRLGVDTITCGNLIGLVMEAREQGRLTEGPLYGDAKGAADLILQISGRQGLGAILSGGIKAAAAQLGLEDLAVHVKGMEPAGYDPRLLKGMGLAYATSARGACHLRATFYKPELAGIIDPAQIDGKAQLFIEFENRLTIFNTMILCVFFRDLIPWESLVSLIRATCGWEFTPDELRQVANRIVAMSRQFNLDQGLSALDDRLPARLFRQSIAPDRSHLTEAEFDLMLADYYRLRGWTPEGIPVAN